MSVSNINHVVLTGRLTSDPDLRVLPSGASVCRLRIAVNGRRRDPNGEWGEKPNYFNVIVFGGPAVNVASYMHTGHPGTDRRAPGLARVADPGWSQRFSGERHRQQRAVPRQPAKRRLQRRRRQRHGGAARDHRRRGGVAGRRGPGGDRARGRGGVGTGAGRRRIAPHARGPAGCCDRPAGPAGAHAVCPCAVRAGAACRASMGRSAKRWTRCQGSTPSSPSSSPRVSARWAVPTCSASASGRTASFLPGLSSPLGSNTRLIASCRSTAGASH